MQLTGLSDLAAAIVEFAASDSSIFVKGEEEHARTNDFRDTETVELADAPAGTYLVRIFSFGDVLTSEYTLFVDLN